MGSKHLGQSCLSAADISSYRYMHIFINFSTISPIQLGKFNNFFCIFVK